ncbi:MAG TPA: ribosome recycling factor [Alphaproteobacteria bacterium]|nr:ribosome recycling factor [Alphaproteobacteria bacterium]HNS44993.1 ribosome recycling factor [Alphaproteobacteria bacterium]
MALDMNDLRSRMTNTVEMLEKEFSGLRTGRASVNMLEPVVVEVYGTKMPLNQVATVSVPESRLLAVQVWDMSNTKAVEKAIRDSGLGLNPQAEGSLIRVPVPELSTERRTELQKVAGKYAEQARIAIRNIRRDGMDTLKKAEKDNEISEDEHKRMSDEVQKLTDQFIKNVDDHLAKKEEDVMKV